MIVDIKTGEILQKSENVISTKITAIEYDVAFNKILVGSDLGEIIVLNRD